MATDNQYLIGGKSIYGFPTFIQDGCLQDGCLEDCNSCPLAQRQRNYYLLPKGIVMYDPDGKVITLFNEKNSVDVSQMPTDGIWVE